MNNDISKILYKLVKEDHINEDELNLLINSLNNLIYVTDDVTNLLYKLVKDNCITEGEFNVLVAQLKNRLSDVIITNPIIHPYNPYPPYAPPVWYDNSAITCSNNSNNKSSFTNISKDKEYLNETE